jgi:hypothetical protein
MLIHLFLVHGSLTVPFKGDRGSTGTGYEAAHLAEAPG